MKKILMILTMALVATSCMDILDAVSYTHLDVYKRQDRYYIHITVSTVF